MSEMMGEILSKRPAYMVGRWYEDFADTERFTLIYNRNCTAACAHCASESTPKAEGKVSVEEAHHYIETAAAHGYKWFCLTGGEALIYWDECIELVRHGSSLGMTMAIETNAYWGRTPEIAEKRLGQLIDAGLKHLPISADAYHLPYVKLANVLNVARIAKRIEMSYIVFFIYSDNEKKDREILEALDREELFYEASECAPLGFAKQLPNEMFRTIDVKTVGDCGELGPLVVPGGDVIACCNPDVPRESPIYLGNLNDEPLSVLLERYAANPYVRKIEKCGFTDLFGRAMKNDQLRAAYGDKTYRHICEFCEEIFKDPVGRAHLKQEIEGASEAPEDAAAEARTS